MHILLLTQVSDYTKQYSYTLIFEETFQNEDGSLKNENYLFNDWFVEDIGNSNIDSLGRYELAGKISSKKEFSQYKLEFHMAVHDAENCGIGIRSGDIYFNIVDEDLETYTISIKEEEIKGKLPEGFDMTIMNKYSIFDTGDVVSVYINDTFLKSIELADYYQNINPKGSISFYSGIGTSIIDNIDVYSMHLRNPQTKDSFIIICLAVFILLSAIFLKIRIDSKD